MLIAVANNTLKESDHSTRAELRIPSNDLITESLNEMHLSELPKNITNKDGDDKPFENSNESAPKKNICEVIIGLFTYCILEFIFSMIHVQIYSIVIFFMQKTVKVETYLHIALSTC